MAQLAGQVYQKHNQTHNPNTMQIQKTNWLAYLQPKNYFKKLKVYFT